ncbi:conserved hypothetical protein [Sphingobacterium multivorum]|jgi:hypothetical protein|uniref:Membrane or secreted protein n=2 Tax=Sphingobacteriaceae TaxID=84566 RepID=A0A654CCA2_SPHMU|nr:conserved hypothetical protein [Sphingobacterium multivorum]
MSVIRIAVLFCIFRGNKFRPVMKNCTLLFFLFFGIYFSKIQAQQLHDGAYLYQDGINKHLMLVKDHYISFISYDDVRKRFQHTWGGPLDKQPNLINIAIEYNSQDSSAIGKTTQLPYRSEADSLRLKIANSYHLYIKQKKVPQDLDALWRITGRQQGEKMQDIPKADRKTIKILVDGYFQWIAINPAQKGFYGTGGGNYQYDNNRYTEKIQFFSRDNNRVGQELAFDGEIVDGRWQHRGKSSKGDDIYEIWSKEITE